MVYRYPVAQVVVGFGVDIVGVLIGSAMAIGLLLLAFVWPERLEGNRLLLLPLEALFLSGAALGVFAFRHYCPRKRPIVVGPESIASLDLWGRTAIELPWGEVDKIDRQFLYDPFASRNGYVFSIHGKGRVVYFDDSLEDASSLILILNDQIAAHNIYANSIERGFGILVGVTDPVERRKLAKNGRVSRVSAF